MTAAFEVKVDEEALDKARRLFEFIGGNSADAIRVAINKAGPKVRTLASTAVRGQVRLTAKYVKDRLTFVKATRNRLSGAIRTPTRGLLTSRYSTDPKISGEKVSWILPPPVPPRGIKVKIKPDRPPVTFRGDTGNTPFYLVLGGGRLAIAARRSQPGPRGGRIKVFHSASLSQVFDDVKDDVAPEASAEYTRQMADAMRYLLAKQQPR